MNTSELRAVEAPKKGWEYIGLDTTTFNVDVEVYKTEAGEYVIVDIDWRLNF